MQSMLRTLPRTARPRLVVSGISSTPRRYAHQSYGNDQSGHPQSNEKNPKAHLEHPGPEAPAKQGTASSASPSSNSQTSTSHSSSSSSGAKPAIHSPKSAAEKDDPDVRKHNEEMRQRGDKTVNQLKEEDNKVDKKFWKGDVGNHSQSKE